MDGRSGARKLSTSIAGSAAGAVRIRSGVREGRECPTILGPGDVVNRDYGELVFHQRLPPPAGVLYMRFEPESPTEPAAFIARLRQDGVELEGRFTMINRNGIRQRPIRTGDTT